jgi:predicted TPR repeat methyltransferase
VTSIPESSSPHAVGFQARSSGSLLADRRYAWAEGALLSGDAIGAADLAAQVIEIAPGYAPAWLLLGNARAAASPGDPDALAAARLAFARAVLIDPADPLGAGLRLAQTGGEVHGSALAPAYVRALFDGYAPAFERHLVEGLGYGGPAKLRDAVLAVTAAQGRHPSFLGVIDLGCGTGLMARALDGMAGSIEGVDLSPAMLSRAEATGLYTALHEGDMVGFLSGRTPASADLVLAADVLVYVRDLLPVFAEVARVLEPGGLFAATLQSCPGDGVVLGEDGRYAHSAGLVRATADRCGFRVAQLDDVSVRRQGGVDVPGLLAVLSRARP